MSSVSFFIFVAATLLSCALAASIVPCPDGCVCKTNAEDDLEAKCSSLGFLQKLRPKQIARTTALDLSARSFSAVDTKINLLKNLNTLNLSGNAILDPSPLFALAKLETLDLSRNRLDKINPKSLPRNVKFLDLSRNNITELHGDWSALGALRRVDLTGNPIACTCHAAAVRESLLKNGVEIAQPVICATPKTVRGLSWAAKSVCPGSAGVWDLMQGDEPLEGSGSGDEDPNNLDTTMEPEYMPDAKAATQQSVPLLDSEEGSGDEDTDYDEAATTVAPVPAAVDETQIERGGGEETADLGGDKPKPCHINCSTPAPVGENDEADASEPPTFLKGIEIIYHDLSGKEEGAPPTPAAEEGIAKEGRKVVQLSEVEVVRADSPKELEKVVEEPRKNAHTTYIVLSVLLLVMIAVIVYAIVKSKNKRARNRRRRMQDKELGKGTEMKLIAAPPANGDKPNNHSAPERVPLMNGQNGTQNGKTPEEPDNKGDYVELRQKNNELTPEAKRVTIRASEIPDSVPKTPLLVNRHVSSDGNIITISTDDQQRVS